MRELSDYYIWQDLVTMSQPAPTIEQLIAFREMHKTFPGSVVRRSYGNLTISVKLPKSERRDRAVQELVQLRKDQEQFKRDLEESNR